MAESTPLFRKRPSKISPLVECCEDSVVVLSSKDRLFFSNRSGKLGHGEGTKSVSSFREISSLFEYEIRAAYAGNSVITTMANYSSAVSHANMLIHPPRRRSQAVPHSALLFSVFIGSRPPRNTPNTRIDDYE
ncbi:hypothetical protein M9Y10_025128 [Tritrichomonas musculus]|uniref:Uncharacterized protein n=1 Tax=Tritrichomonas musculus TaxID=1915356 RepID=A0ABR2HBU3_9EUKA